MFSHAGERRAIASTLLCGLERYGQDTQALVKGYDPERYRKLAQQFDHLRLLASSLPELSVPWVALLISRAELTFALFKAPHDPAARASIPTMLERHREHLEELMGSCARLIKADAARTH